MMIEIDGKSRRRRWSFRIGVAIIIAVIFPAMIAEFIAPYPYGEGRIQDADARPTLPSWRNVGGAFLLRPVLLGRPDSSPCYGQSLPGNECAYPIILFPKGYEYRLFGFIPMNRRLFGTQGAGDQTPRLYLLGADENGRDRLSRLLVAAKSSLSVAILSTILASLIGVLIGAAAGYGSQMLSGRKGLWLESSLMRLADSTLALPSLVLILAARAAYPVDMPPLQAELLMIKIFVVLGWAETARLTCGLVLDFRKRDFVLAARSLGASSWRVLRTHILRMAFRPLMAQALLLLSDLFLAETSLSFLGVGLQPPEPSWGNMLKTSFNIQTIRNPGAWAELSPAFLIIVFVFGIRLLAQGLEKREENHRNKP
jgi:peptide/nickel transport system permease protein